MQPSNFFSLTHIIFLISRWLIGLGKGSRCTFWGKSSEGHDTQIRKGTMQIRFSHDSQALGKDITAIRTRRRKLEEESVAKRQERWNCNREAPSLIPALTPSRLVLCRPKVNSLVTLVDSPRFASVGQLGFLNFWAKMKTTCLPVILLPL